MNKVQFYRMPKAYIPQLIPFVLGQNYVHHGETNERIFQEQTVALMAEEESYADPEIFMAVAGKEICGSIRIFKKRPGERLPLEKMYSVDVHSFVEEGGSIYHIGRFAVKKGSDEKGFRIFKTLMALALKVAGAEEGTVFAECDCKLIRTIRLLGVEAEAIGPSVFYLGSETVPIRLPWAGYEGFLKRNRALVEDEIPLFRSAGSGRELQR